MNSTQTINLNDCRDYVNIESFQKIKMLKRNLSNKGINEYGCLLNNHLSTNSDDHDYNSVEEDEKPTKTLRLKLKGKALKQKVRNLSAFQNG